MDPRRASRIVIDPKVRTVGFNAPVGPASPCLSQSVPNDSVPASVASISSNSLSPVMIPPKRNASVPVPVPVPASPLRRDGLVVGAHIVSYNPLDSMSGNSPRTLSPGSRIDGSEYTEEMSVCSEKSGGGGKVASSFPGTSLHVVNNPSMLNNLTKVSVVNSPLGVSDKEHVEKGEGPSTGVRTERSGSSKLKEKTSKAERRAIQEAQHAAKALTKSTGTVPANSKQHPNVPKTTPQKKDSPHVTAKNVTSKKKDVVRLLEKERKKDVSHVPQPRMQFDDKQRVEKAKKRAVVNQCELSNIVELFRHMPQYAHGTHLPYLESNFFQLDAIHPSVYKVGLQYLAGDVTGGNARCIAMLQAFREAINDYSTPREKTLIRDLTAKISSYVSFLIECRPLSISMGNAIRFLKNRIAKLPMSLSETEAKLNLELDIVQFINEKIVIADKAIVEHAVTKINDGDVLLTHGSSCVVEMVLIAAFEHRKQFRVIIVDSRPKLEGQMLLRRLVAKGLSCTYTHINAISYIMHEVTRVFLGAASVLCNGTVYSRVGTACVAMVAHACQVPVIICCEAYKFHNRAQLDSICSNELGDPCVISKVPGRKDVNYLDNWADNDNLQLLNLTYDATPPDYVSMVITDYGMVPPTSVPVIVREYCRDLIWL